MPKINLSLRDLVETVTPGALSDKIYKWSSYAFYMTYFLSVMQRNHGWATDVPLFMHMLQNLHRASNHTFSKWHLKSFHNTQRVLTIHHHSPFECLGGACTTMFIPTETGQLHHYRNDCRWSLAKECPYYKNHTVLDEAILRFKTPLLTNTLHTLRHLGFLKA